jgi:hypothetical protein
MQAQPQVVSGSGPNSGATKIVTLNTSQLTNEQLLALSHLSSGLSAQILLGGPDVSSASSRSQVGHVI